MLRMFGRVLAATLFLIAGAGTAQAQTIPLTGGTYSQDFNTLSNTAGSTTNTALPTGWLMTETGGGARDNEQYAVDTGSGNTGDTYSYGSAGSIERAFGGLRSGTLIPVIGACFTNNTGGGLGGFAIAYTGEQWRLGTAARTDRLDFQYSLDATSLATGTWTDVDTLDFTTPNTATVGAKDGNAAANRTAISGTVSSIAIASGATFCLRWNDLDATSADDGLAIDDFSITTGGTAQPVLTVNDVSLLEGDSGTTTFGFTVSLSIPAGAGGVTFDLATADGTAAAGSDYVANALTGQTIPAGSSSYSFSVIVNGDTAPEASETFFVNLANVTGATVGDAQGQGTIQNDDVAVVQIHEIQGNGLISPLNGAVVTTEGIVTAQKFNNGFFLQTPDTGIDADPNTSQGIFVFTSTAPPATAAVGNRVRVTGTVSEFTPSTNLNQLPITELVSVTSIQVLSSGNPLPAPVVLSSTDFGAGATPGTAEKFEGMRVTIGEAWVVAASDGNITESSATSSTTGVFHVTLANVDRPFREPGIGVMDVFPIPGGKNPPRFDTNQERIMVRSRGQVGASSLALDVDAQILNMTGVLDYFSGTWALLPDVGSGTVSGGKTAVAVTDVPQDYVTIAGANLLRFFDEVNDSNGAPTLTAAAVDKRLTKTSLAICDYLRAPDILGVVEVENLRVLGLLADRINATCARAPQYVPYLVQGNDVGGINVGFLVSNRSLGLVNRVEVLEVTQFGKNTLFVNPDSSTSLLNDRPPLLLRAIVHADNGATYPVTIIVNHLRSLNGLDDTGPGSGGWPSEGDRVRNKRAQQAAFLADLVHNRQVADPNERIILLGDFNAFEFNDGYVDVMGIVRGDEVPADQAITHIPSPIARPLIDGSELILDPIEKYSYVFEGNAQTLDHVVVNEPVVMDAADILVDHARINADFGVHHYGTAGIPLRVSDHDPVRIAIAVPQFRSADIAVTALALQTAVHLDETATFRVRVDNLGPSVAGATSLALVFNALVAPTVSAPSGWTCAAPVQNAGTTTVTCTTPSLDTGFAMIFDAEIVIDSSLPNGPLRLDAAVSSQTADPANANNQASASVEVSVFADLGVFVAATTPTVNANNPANFTVNVANFGTDRAEFGSVAMVFDALVSPTVTAPAGWTCAAPVQDATTTTVTCTATDFSAGQFDVSVPTASAQQADWTLRLAAAVTSQMADNDRSNNTGSASVLIRVFTNLRAALTTSTPTIDPGQTARFTATLENSGLLSAAAVTGTFGFDALVSPTVVAPSGWTCAAPTQTATSTTVVCTTPSMPNGAHLLFDISFVADAASANRVVTATATISASIPDPFPNDNQATASVAVRDFPDADLGVSVAATAPSVTVGGTAAYTATVTNDGPGPADGTTATFVFDALVSPTLTAPADWSCNAPTQDATSTTVTCARTTFAAGASSDFTASFPAVAGLAGRAVVLTVAVASPTSDPVTGNNSASASVAILSSADLGVTVTTSTPAIQVGGTADYTVTVNNAGPTAASPVSLTLSFDALITPTITAPSAAWTCAAPTQTATATNVVCSSASGIGVGSASFTARFVAGAALNGRTVRLTASVSAGTLDPVPGNNQGSAAVQILSSADLSIRFMGRSERAGVFLLPVTNAGPSAAQAPVVVTFTGNTALANVSVIPPVTGWTCTSSGTTSSFTVTCRSLNPMGPGVTDYFGMTVLGRGTRFVTLTASVSSLTPDPNPGNNSVTQTLRSAGLPFECRHFYCRR